MECVPSNLSYEEVQSDLQAITHVCRVHDLRLWAISSDQSSVTCHLVLNRSSSGLSSNHEVVLREANKVLKVKHGIAIVTIQVEEFKEGMSDCTDCQPLSATTTLNSN